MNVRPGVLDFLQQLQSLGVVTAEGMQRAKAAVDQTGEAIDIVLRELGILPEKAIAREIARFLSIANHEGMLRLDDNPYLDRIGHMFASANGIVPQEKLGDGELHVVVANPFDADALNMTSYFFDLPLRLSVAPRSLIEEQLATFHRQISEADTPDVDGAMDNLDTERLLDIARDAPVVKFVQRLLLRAVDERATDIHIEPQSEFTRIRLRRDGMLTSTDTAPAILHPGIMSRLKILARLNIAERRLPQDGRLRSSIRGQEIDFRLSIMPTVHGETAVLRILDRETVPLDLVALGYDATSAAKVRQIVRRPNGIVLVTGPTGSGKTTTLYAVLSELNQPEVKIFTVEDPVEYRIPGITQLQVDHGIGLTFASALRSVLRQDPDIILVGEIRDRQTAEIAVQAALTGHLVLSTLHTNSAVGAFSRLRDMGVEPFLLDATIRGVIGQRLVRQTCCECHGENDAHECPVCKGTGFTGRRATFEILNVSDAMRHAISTKAPEQEMQALATAEGMVAIREHALSLAASGKTTLGEVMRVIESEAP